MKLSPRQKELLGESVATLALPQRTINSLENAGVQTIGELLYCCPKHGCRCNRNHLLEISNFGYKTLAQVFEALSKLGFTREESS